MVLKFFMQHDEAAALQSDEIKPGRDQKWPLLLKIAKQIKSTFFQNHMIYLAEILYRVLVGP